MSLIHPEPHAVFHLKEQEHPQTIVKVRRTSDIALNRIGYCSRYSPVRCTDSLPCLKSEIQLVISYNDIYRYDQLLHITRYRYCMGV